MRISDWSSDVCSSDLPAAGLPVERGAQRLDTLQPGLGQRLCLLRLGHLPHHREAAAGAAQRGDDTGPQGGGGGIVVLLADQHPRCSRDRQKLAPGENVSVLVYISVGSIINKQKTS